MMKSSSPAWRSSLGRLGVLSGQDVCHILSKHGFRNVRQRGSHIIMQKKTDTSTITIPVPNHKEIKLGTLKSIIRQSRLLPDEFVLR
jgi:predicted RNA binding protein YcfA (HicA-like mRNA interferase family)